MPKESADASEHRIVVAASLADCRTVVVVAFDGAADAASIGHERADELEAADVVLVLASIGYAEAEGERSLVDSMAEHHIDLADCSTEEQSLVDLKEERRTDLAGCLMAERNLVDSLAAAHHTGLADSMAARTPGSEAPDSMRGRTHPAADRIATIERK